MKGRPIEFGEDTPDGYVFGVASGRSTKVHLSRIDETVERYGLSLCGIAVGGTVDAPEHMNGHACPDCWGRL